MPENTHDSTSVMVNGVLIDPVTKQWQKGTPSPNPGGRPLKKRDMLDKLMKTFYGPECEALFLDMVEIAQYDRKVSKDRWPKYTSQQVSDARKFLFQHFFGMPIQENKTEITTPESHKIEVEFVDSDDIDDTDED